MGAVLAELIETSRLRLMPLGPEHAMEMAEVLADPGLYTFTGGTPAGPEELLARYERWSEGSPNPGVFWLNWVIWFREQRRLAGTVQATVSLADQGRVAEVAWIVGLAWHRRGIATEAARALVAWLRTQPVDVVVAHIHPDHDASSAVAAAAGLAPTGHWQDGERTWARRLDGALGAGATIDGMNRMFSSGEFARQTRLSAKALRIYDETGLLRPAEVDPENGYRRYAAFQVRDGRLIGMLRGADMPLAEIGQLLTELENDREEAVARLSAHLDALEVRHTSRRFLIRHIHAILREEEQPMFPVQTRHVAAIRVMSIQRRLRAPETDGFVKEAKAAFAAHLNGARPTGPFTLIFHGIVDHESDGPLEAVLGCPDDVSATDLIGIRTEPAHDEAFTTITKAQWDFPAILAAYDAVAASSEVQARPKSRLSCREVYVAEPAEIKDDELICDIAFPLG